MKIKKFINDTTDTFRELFVIYFSSIFLCASIFSLAEGKSFFDSLWWSFVTGMTVGYGDIYPVTFIGRLDGIVLMHIVPFFIAPLIISRFIEKVLENKDKFTNDEQEELKASLKRIEKRLNDSVVL